VKHKIAQIQDFIKSKGLDGWLLYDFRGLNSIALEITGIEGVQTRRWFYFIPAKGNPVALIHRIEVDTFNVLSGKKILYVSWRELEVKLQEILKNARRIAMEYSPHNAIPYVSLVDAGTIEMIKGLGKEVVSSADLVSRFQATWDKKDYENHSYAAKSLIKIKDEAFAFVRQNMLKKETLTEYQLQQFIYKKYSEYGLVSDELPLASTKNNTGNPHYTPTESTSLKIELENLVLIDIFAKKNEPKGIYSDITWMAFTGEKVPEKHADIFSIVCQARDKAVELIRKRHKSGENVFGWEVDDAARGVIRDKGYGDYFVHRTGHSLGLDVHYKGPNIDNLETKDERMLIPNVGFTIEPGIYLDEFGVRSEINVFMSADGPVVTTVPLQQEIIPLLK
jgi:Xaa-Pro dipeptidase